MEMAFLLLKNILPKKNDEVMLKSTSHDDGYNFYLITKYQNFMNKIYGRSKKRLIKNFQSVYYFQKEMWRNAYRKFMQKKGKELIITVLWLVAWGILCAFGMFDFQTLNQFVLSFLFDFVRCFVMIVFYGLKNVLHQKRKKLKQHMEICTTTLYYNRMHCGSNFVYVFCCNESRQVQNKKYTVRYVRVCILMVCMESKNFLFIDMIINNLK